MSHAHLLGLGLGAITILLPSCRQPVRLSTPEALAPCYDNTCSRPAEIPIPEGAQLAAEAFVKAIRASDWDRALACCMDRVQEAARKHETVRVFFESVVPLDKMPETPRVDTRGAMGRSHYGFTVPLTKLDEKPVISWRCHVQKTQAGWRVDFLTVSLSEYIANEWRQYKRHELGGLPDDAYATMRRFQQALRDEDWAGAMSFCSHEMKDAAGRYPSFEAFFRDVVPVGQLLPKTCFPVSYSQGDQVYGSFLNLTEPGEEPGAQWIWYLKRGGDGWIIDFKPTPLQTWIAQEKARQLRTIEDHRARTRLLEPMLEGVRTRLTPVNREFVLGQPMLFRLELTNGGPAQLLYDDQQAAVNGSMSITDQQGRPVPYVALGVQTCGASEPIAPGQTVILFDKLDIAGQYEIVKPGRYRVQFNGHGLSIGAKVTHDGQTRLTGSGRAFPSNIVEIEVKAGPP